MSYFWTNTIWYVLLGVLTLIELVFIIFKAENRRLAFAFYLTISGLVLYFETANLIFLKAYAYYPKILQHPPFPYHDVLAGNLFSQFSVAATALMVAVLNLNYYWFIFFAIIYGIIEELFLALGIFSHNWYRTWMTVILLPLFFWTAKIMFIKIKQGIKPIFYCGYIYLGLFPLVIIILIWGFFQLLGIEYGNATLFHDPNNSRFFIFTVYFNLISIPIMLIYFLRFKLIWKTVVILLLYTIYYIGYKLNLIIIKEGWFLPVSTITIFWTYLSVFILDRLYDAKSKPDYESRKIKVQ